jgi:hypothetical protein
MQGVITGVINGVATGVVTNTNALCTYVAGIASYSVNGTTQTLFASNTTIVPPGATVTLTVPVPQCLFEVDLFIGNNVINGGANGHARYGSNLLDTMSGSNGSCSLPSPTPTLTTPPTNTPVPPTLTESPLCVFNLMGDVTGAITGVVNGIATGVVTNQSPLCSYSVGIASYSIAENGAQTFFQGNTTSIPPGAQITLTVMVPPCTYEVDLFRGNQIEVNGANGAARYGARLMSSLVSGIGTCTPPATATPTATPPSPTVGPNLTVPPTPTNTVVPNATPTETPIPGAPTATPTNTPGVCCGGPIFLFFPPTATPQVMVVTATPVIGQHFVPPPPPPPPPSFGPHFQFQGPRFQQPSFGGGFGGAPVLAGSVPVLSGVLPSIFPAPAPVAGVQSIAGLPMAPVQGGVAGIIDVPEQPALAEVQGVSEQIRPAQLPNTGIATGGLDVLTLIAVVMMIAGLGLVKIASRVRRRA